jgi:Flp pilus assembly protein TadG
MSRSSVARLSAGLVGWVRSAPLTTRLRHDRRAAIALITALATPVLLMSVAMGIEIGHWSDVKLQLQRTADLAALAGAQSYSDGASAQTAANAAANVAEFNAGVGGGARIWTASSQTLSDNQVTVQITNGVNNPTDPAVRVTVTRSVPRMFSFIAVSGGAGAVTMEATSLAEIGKTVNSVQPCILTLNGGTNGAVATPGTTLSGNVNVDLNGCSMVSDGNTSMGGNMTLNASGIYSAGSITMHGSVSGTGTVPANQYQNSPPIPDPYARDAAVQGAIAQADCGPTTQPVVSKGMMNLYPNVCYGSIKVNGQTMVAFNGTGLYTVNGSFTVNGTSNGTTLSANGITLATTGAISVSGDFSTGAVTLTAATAGTAAHGAIPGVLFATNTTDAITVSGNSGIPFSGLIYAPNSAISLSGNATSGSSGCSEVIADTLTISGNMDLAANCSNYDLLKYGSLPNTTTIGLVE